MYFRIYELKKFILESETTGTGGIQVLNIRKINEALDFIMYLTCSPFFLVILKPLLALDN